MSDEEARQHRSALIEERKALMEQNTELVFNDFYSCSAAVNSPTVGSSHPPLT